jgi:hypothetical protein
MNSTRMRSGSIAAMLGFLMLASAGVATAQDFPGVEVSAGYNVVRADGDTNGRGWYADAGANLTRMVSIVGQATGNYKSITGIEGGSFDSNLHTFMGGIRLHARSPMVTPFVHALFGAMRTAGSASVLADVNLTSLLGDVNVSASETHAAMQLGGGVNFMAVPNIGIRVGADYLRGLQKDGGNAFRFSTGVVIPFGK